MPLVSWSRVVGFSCHGGRVLERYRGQHAEAAVAALSVVEDLQVVEDRVGQLPGTAAGELPWRAPPWRLHRTTRRRRPPSARRPGDRDFRPATRRAVVADLHVATGGVRWPWSSTPEPLTVVAAGARSLRTDLALDALEMAIWRRQRNGGPGASPDRGSHTCPPFHRSAVDAGAVPVGSRVTATTTPWPRPSSAVQSELVHRRGPGGASTTSSTPPWSGSTASTPPTPGAHRLPPTAEFEAAFGGGGSATLLDAKPHQPQTRISTRRPHLWLPAPTAGNGTAGLRAPATE